MAETVNKESGLKVTGTLLRLVAMIFGIAAAYFLTIQSLRIELAAKAESAIVEQLDKKLNNIEVILKETVLSKEQFYKFSTNLETRLARIEYHLSEITGEKIDKP
ncbi:MAG: hypothetical protein IID63_03695 [candidate division Zixibacteria bacterium]|nr:hypothetical protein [candidate division Zixibacteria bacterium]